MLQACLIGDRLGSVSCPSWWRPSVPGYDGTALVGDMEHYFKTHEMILVVIRKQWQQRHIIIMGAFECTILAEGWNARPEISQKRVSPPSRHPYFPSYSARSFANLLT